MAADLDLVNRALMMLGGETISAMPASIGAADSPNAATAFLLYQPTVDELLAEYPWRFAVRRVQLDQPGGGGPPNSLYKYQYSLPANTLRVVNVDIAPGVWEIYRDASGDARRIYCDEPTAWADVIIRPTSQEYYPTHFQRAVVARLAKAFAMPVTRRTEFFSSFSQMAEVEVGRAKMQDWNEQPWPELDDGNLIAEARYAV